MDVRRLSQSELAKLLGKDRTTVRAWTLAGMPYEKPERKGMRARFDSGICLNWFGGHRLAEANELNINPLEKVALGWFVGSGAAEDGRVTKENERIYLEMMGRAGVDKHGALQLLAFARGVLT